MTKLLNSKTKEYDEIPGSEVNAAIDSGLYNFGSTRNVPIAQDGAAIWVKASDASKYRKGLTFLSDEDVLKGNATERFRGMGGTVAGLGYGFLKGASLGLAPLAIEALGGQGGEDFVRDIELGAPTATTIGDVGGLLVDPVAAFGRLGGKAVAKGAGLAAEHAGSSLAANEIAAGATRLETAAPAVAGRAGAPVAKALRQPPTPPTASVIAGRLEAVSPPSLGQTEAPRLGDFVEERAASAASHASEIDRVLGGVKVNVGNKVYTGADRSVFVAAEKAATGVDAKEKARYATKVFDTQLGFAERKLSDADKVLLGEARAGRDAELASEGSLALPIPPSPRTATATTGPSTPFEVSQPGLGYTPFGPHLPPDGLPLEARSLFHVPEGLAASTVRADAAAKEVAGRSLFHVPPEPAGVVPMGPPSLAAAEGSRLNMSGLSLPIQGAIYGGASQLSREQAGLEEGEPGSVLKAAAIGGAIPLVLGLGGKAFGRAATATGSALSGNQRIQKFAAGIEETHVLRMADSGVADVQRINREFTTPLTGEQGTRKYADFIKNAVHNIDNIKADPSNAGNALVQSLPSAADGGTKLWNMNPQRLATLADATVSVYSAEYKALYNAVGHEPVALSTLQKIAADVRGTQASMAPTTSMKSVQGELNEFENAIARATPDPITGVAQQKFTINDLQDTRTRFGEAFSNTQAGGEWTPQQSAFYKGLRNGVVDAAESVKPGMKNTFDALDPLYTMAKSFQEGAARAAAKKAIKSPISQDQVTKASLGVAAIGTPGAAVLFFGVSTLFRHGYAQRGEGFIAEMAGKVAGSSLMANPAGAAQFVGASILNAKRPMMLGYNAERLVETTPKEYTEIVAAVHGLQATRDKVRADVMSSLSDSTPEQQKQTANNVDTLLNQMVKTLPTGLSPGKELTQQEKNYTIFFKALLDPTRFGTQVIVNGGPGVDAAKAALGATPQGQEYLDKLYTVLNEAVQSNEKLRSQKMGPGSIKKIITSFRSTSHSSLGTIHGAGAGQEAEGPSSPVAPSAATGARNAFAQNVSLGSGTNIG